MRLIDADALKENAIHYSETEYHFAHDAVTVDDIDDAPTIAAPRWVRCGDRYPDKDGLYMFYGDEYFTPDHNGDVDHYKTIIVGYWSRFSPTIVGKMVITHWMPLLEPPKEEV